MSVVGEFPGIARAANRRTIRAPVNELDKSTVVSIFPKEIKEVKCTIQPGVFEIPAGTFDSPAILVVGPSSWWREIDEDQPLLEIPHSSIQIADSVVRDYCNGYLACEMGSQMPGLFYIPGVWTVERLKKEQMPLLLKYQAMQKKWYLEIIKIADILWSRSNGNPLAVSSDARLACKELHIENKPWIGDIVAAELVRCIACGSLRNPLFPICQSCHAIVDKEKAKELGLTFAQ
jgi:hypothetical protein